MNKTIGQTNDVARQNVSGPTSDIESVLRYWLRGHTIFFRTRLRTYLDISPLEQNLTHYEQSQESSEEDSRVQ